jgi:hypothetical protein
MNTNNILILIKGLSLAVLVFGFSNVSAQHGPNTHPIVKGNTEARTEAENMISIYPNPASTRLSISTEMLKEDQYLEICDAGRKVYKKYLLASDGAVPAFVDVSGWQPGIYSVTIATGQKIITKRVVVE